MLVQLFNRGRGGGAGPVGYTTEKIVPKFGEDGKKIMGEFKTREPAPVIVRGDPARTEMLIDSSQNAWKYTSGVLAFGDSDKPSDQEIQAVIDDFESTFYAGLESDKFDVLWVKHTHEGNTELHFVAPRLELSTGKALNAFPPGYEKMSDAWRDKWNFDKGWESPSDPARAKLVKVPDFTQKMKVDDARQQITNFLTQRVVDGLIEDRSGVVKSLSEIGQINRESAEYISIKVEGIEKPIRLKGAIYDQNFKRNEFVGKAESKDRAGLSGKPSTDSERAKQASERLAGFVQARSEYNTGRYSREPKKQIGTDGALDRQRSPDSREHGPRLADQALERDRGFLRTVESSDSQTSDTGQERTEWHDENGERAQRIDREPKRSDPSEHQGEPKKSHMEHSDRPVSLVDYLRRELGPDSVFERPGTSQPSAAQPTASDARSSKKSDVGCGPHDYSERREVRPVAARERGAVWVQSGRSLGSEILKKIKDRYERTRTAVNQFLKKIEREARQRSQIFEQSGDGLVRTGERLGRLAGDVRAGATELDSASLQLERDTQDFVRAAENYVEKQTAPPEEEPQQELQKLEIEREIPSWAKRDKPPGF